MFGVIPKQSFDVRMPGFRIKDIKDGVAKTTMLSEGVTTGYPEWGGPISETIYGNMGAPCLLRP